MSLEYIREYYKVPAYKNVKVLASGKPGVIVGARNAYIKIKLEGEKQAKPYHPTYEIEYLP